MNVIVYTALAAWAVAQLLKVVVGLFRHGRSDAARIGWRLVWAGGMPSSHSSVVAATLATIGLEVGPASPEFGLAFVLTAIVLHDRSKLHHMYLVFQQHFPDLRAKAQTDPVLRDLVGHTTGEIVAGLFVGAAVAFGRAWMLGIGA